MKLSKGVDKDLSPVPVDCSVVDMSDGTYELKWRTKKAGVYSIDVLVDGAHVGGSPVKLIVKSAKPAVGQMEVCLRVYACE